MKLHFVCSVLGFIFPLPSLLAWLLGIKCPEVPPSERPSACQGLYFIKLLRVKTEIKVYQR